LQGADLDIGSHSKSHPDFGVLDEQWIDGELVEPRRAIEQHLGFAPSTFAIPLGQSANWTARAHERAKAAGYEIIYAQAEETRFPGAVPRTFVTRFDRPKIFSEVLEGVFDRWEEWV